MKRGKNMYKCLTAMLIVICFCSIAVEQVLSKDNASVNLYTLIDGPQVELNITIGESEYDAFFDVIQTEDGGFVGFGTCNGRTYASGGDFFLVKALESGQVEWQWSYGGNGTELGQALVHTTDNGYALLGWTSSNNVGDIWLVKTNTLGLEQWNRTYGGPLFEQSGKALLQTNDGGFLFVGLTYSYVQSGGSDGWMVKVDANGNEQWNHTYGTNTNDEHFWGVTSTSDNGYIMTGFSHNKSTKLHSVWVVKTDAEGNLQWEKKFGPANQGLDIIQTLDGGYILIAEAEDTAFGEYLNAWMIKIDSLGNEEWNKIFITPKGKNNFAVLHSIKQLGDGSYILAGVTNGVTPVFSVGDLWCVKTDENGNVLWDMILGGSKYDTTYGIDVTTDGKFIIAGATKSFGAGNFDAWLVKLSDFENQRPLKPATPSGASKIKPNEEYTYSTLTTDSDSEQLYYIWDWGDGNYSYWLVPYSSGVQCEASHNWSEKKTYQIRVMAKDEEGGESDWSDPLPISMPFSYDKLHLRILSLLFNRLSPGMFPILRQMHSCMINKNCVSENEFTETLDMLKKETPFPTGMLQNAVIPNDQFFSQQWALENTGQTGGTPDSDIDAAEAWDIETGNPDVIIAIVDSGIDLTHPDLIDNIWTNEDEVPSNGIDDDENGYVDDYRGYDFILEDGNPDPLDHNGHGTVMSGVIAAMTNNEIGISGIAWNCKIMPVKVVDANWTSKGDSIFDGIRYAADNGAKVICMAFAFPNSVSKLKEAVNYAHDKGAVLVCAAGNFDNNRKNYPAAYDNVIAVAGTDHADHRMEALYEFNGEWVNSSYGDWVDIAAPGESIFTTSPTYHVTLCDTWGYELNYDNLSGTTLAAPVVAGVASLIFSKNPAYSPDKVAAILKANSDPYDSEYDLGFGRVNAYKALMEINKAPEKPNTPNGLTSGKVNDYYNYSTSTIDSDGDQLFYLFDWGNGNNSSWLGPYNSNQMCTASHNWTEKGSYEIKVKAKDVFGLESDWSDPLPIQMSYSHTKPQLPFLSWLFERLPYDFELLRHLLEN